MCRDPPHRVRLVKKRPVLSNPSPPPPPPPPPSPPPASFTCVTPPRLGLTDNSHVHSVKFDTLKFGSTVSTRFGIPSRSHSLPALLVCSGVDLTGAHSLAVLDPYSHRLPAFTSGHLFTSSDPGSVSQSWTGFRSNYFFVTESSFTSLLRECS